MTVPQHVQDVADIELYRNRDTAWIPYRIVNGRPRNPFAPTGSVPGKKRKRHRGERKCVDMVVYCTVGGEDYVLLGERADGLGWALLGGGLEPSEHVRDAATREVFEEGDLRVDRDRWRLSRPRYVPDPRADDEHWYVTVLATVDLGELDELPATLGKTDIRRTAWFRRRSYVELLAELDERFGGVEFGAHRFILAELFQEDIEDAA